MSRPTRKEFILVVDADCAYLEFLKSLLELRGHHVVTAATLAAAQRVMQEAVPDRAVINADLPDGSGADFVEDKRTRGDFVQTRFIVVADGPDENARQKPVTEEGLEQILLAG